MLDRVIEYRNGPDVDFEVGVILGDGSPNDVSRIKAWNIAGNAPTQPEVDALLVDADFVTWNDEHGADPVKTRRREAIDEISKASLLGLVLRALSQAFRVLSNQSNKVPNDILDAIENATSLSDLQTRCAAITKTPDRTSQQIFDFLESKITDGSADGR